MNSKIMWHFFRQLRKVWVRVVGFALLAILTAIVSQTVAPLIPPYWTVKIGSDSVDQVLNILASSMLAVTTFSIAIATSAFSAAASSATPRATALLQEDSTAQNVIATFLGAFLFSLVGIVALQAGYYSNAGRLVLFIMTGAVLAAVIIALLRWISHLMTFGRMGDTLARVEAAAITSLENRLEHPFLRGNPLVSAIPDFTVPVFAAEVGYVQHIDMSRLQQCTADLDMDIWLCALPGTFVHDAKALVHVEQEISDPKIIDRLRSAFTIGAERTFDQDPRFGMIVIAEIASRALSPAVNDPGTAISVVGRIVRILSRWKEQSELDVEFRSVFVPCLDASEMITDAFRPIIRDGAANFEIQMRVRKALHALAAISPAIFAETAAALSEEAIDIAKSNLNQKEFSLLIKLE